MRSDALLPMKHRNTRFRLFNRDTCMNGIILTLFIFLAAFLPPRRIVAQTAADSLKTVLETARDEHRVDVLNSLAAVYFTSNFETGLPYAEEAVELSAKIGYRQGQAEALSMRGYLRHSLYRLDEAMEDLQEAIRLCGDDFDKTKGVAYLRLSYLYNRMGQPENSFDAVKTSYTFFLHANEMVDASYAANYTGFKYWRISRYDSALVYYRKALDIREETGDQRNIALTANNIGVLYYQWGDYENALEYYMKAMRLYDESGSRNGVSLTMVSIGKTYKDLGKTDDALGYFNRSLEISRKNGHDYAIAYALNNIGSVHEQLGELPSALSFYEESLATYQKIKDVSGIALNQICIGNVHYLMNNYDEAVDFLKQGYDTAAGMNNMENQALALKNLGDVYFGMNDFLTALDHFRRSLEISRDIGKLDLVRDTHARLSDLYSAMNDNRNALAEYRLYSAVKDSLLNEKVAFNIDQLKIRYDMDRIETENTLLRQQKTASEAELRLKRTINLITSAALVCILAITVTIYFMSRERKKTNVLLARTNNELSKQRDEISKKNSELENALSRIKVLSGLLPICASCKKIRDDSGYWKEVEYYISEHSDAVFSHGICPECIQKYYPNVHMTVKDKKNKPGNT